MPADAHHAASSLPEPQPSPTELRTFLIADVRGYTRFTQEHGDEAAAQLATRFAAEVRAGVAQEGGQVLELRGDEALAVFTSARRALRAALDVQARLAEATEANPALPLRVGIGLDAGEAVPVEGGYRGGALNLAARLCSLAGPGEVLASEAVVHLAGTVDGLACRERDAVRLKGLAKPVRVIEVVRAAQPAGSENPVAPAAVPLARLRRFGRRQVVGLASAAGVLVVVIALFHPAPPPTRRIVLLKDALNNPRASSIRPASQRGEWALGFRGGELYIRQLRQDPSNAVFQDFQGSGAQTDSALSVDARLVGGTAQRYVMLNCRASSYLSSGYWLKLYPASQTAELVRYDSGTASVLQTKRSAAIHPGAARNHLELICLGSAISARVNDTLVISVNDRGFDSGIMALGVGRDAGARVPTEARFAHLELDKLVSGR